MGIDAVDYGQLGAVEEGAGLAVSQSLPNPSAAAALAHWRFSKAEAAWKQNKERLPGKACRELWALQKQATVGDCDAPKPEGMFNGNAKEQWRLWNSLYGLSQDEAKAMFIERLQKDGIMV